MSQELTIEEQAIWAAQAHVSDSREMETLLMPLPAAVAVQARELAESPGQIGMEYDEGLKCAYWLTHRPDGIFVCVTFGYVPDMDAAARLWTLLSDKDCEPSIDDLLTVYKEATGIEIEAIPLH